MVTATGWGWCCDGREIGAWTHRAAGTAMAVDVDLFEPASARARDALQARLGELAAFLGYRRVSHPRRGLVILQRRRMRRPMDDGVGSITPNGYGA